ncbi:unnamed protein product [Lathyrus oleraceus]
MWRRYQSFHQSILSAKKKELDPTFLDLPLLPCVCQVVAVPRRGCAAKVEDRQTRRVDERARGFWKQWLLRGSNGSELREDLVICEAEFLRRVVE